MGKFCEHCGSELKDNADICVSCGVITHQNEVKSYAWGNQGREYVIAKNIEGAMEIVLMAVNNINSFNVKNIDSNEHVIYVGVRMSAFSWGENLTIRFNKSGENKTVLSIQSTSKLGTELVANSKNKKNIEQLIQQIEKYV